MNEQALNEVTLVTLDQLPALRVRNRYAEALIALQGAQVLEYTPTGTKPVIWLSDQAQLKRGQVPRGGIPVCWPWFGDLERNPEVVRAQVVGTGLPAHGLVRAQDWTIEHMDESADGTEVVLRYPVPAGLLPAWPHPVELQLTIRVGATLQLALTTKNRGSASLTLSQALHSYFAISHIDRVAIHGLDGATYLDSLQEWREFTQAGPVTVTSETDRVYQNVPALLRLVDAGWARTIFVRTQNSRSAVVWNPWIDKAKRLSQFDPDAWQRMLCIESANVLSDCVQLAPGATHTLHTELWSEPS